MPEDVGGTPFPDGREPDDDHHGDADEEFAAVVFDEDFVRSAPVHEPTAVERLLAAAEARAEAADTEARRRGARRFGADDDAYGEEPDDDGGYDGGPAQEFDDELYDPDLLEDGYGRPRYGPARWHRPVAWVLALLMGIGMVALAFTAVYRGASSSGGNRQPVPPPATVGREDASSAPDHTPVGGPAARSGAPGNSASPPDATDAPGASGTAGVSGTSGAPTPTSVGPHASAH